MARKFSAYLSIYNDWDILSRALRSVADRVDELVVVDGAYEWMVPYLAALGVDPLRSDARVYDAIASTGIPYRVISKLWSSEPEKRRAGYEACANDYIYRVDADEILFFDDHALETALSAGAAVGEMVMPNYVAPGWISVAKGLGRIERQCFLFDRRQISADIHLNYLWLILTADTLPAAGVKPFAVHPTPLAFNAHLTGWRTPRTAVNRAAFYVLNWMRQNGVPWLPDLRDKPLSDIQALFNIVSADDFRSSLSRSRIAFGMIEPANEREFLPSPLSAEQEGHFIDLFDTFLASLADTNRQAAGAEQPFLTSQPTVLDLSTPAARSAVAPTGMVSIRFSAPLLSAKAQLLSYSRGQPENETRELPVTVSGPEFHIELPTIRWDDSPMLRQCLEFSVWPDPPRLSRTFRVLA